MVGRKLVCLQIQMLHNPCVQRTPCPRKTDTTPINIGSEITRALEPNDFRAILEVISVVADLELVRPSSGVCSNRGHRSTNIP